MAMGVNIFPFILGIGFLDAYHFCINTNLRMLRHVDNMELVFVKPSLIFIFFEPVKVTMKKYKKYINMGNM